MSLVSLREKARVEGWWTVYRKGDVRERGGGEGGEGTDVMSCRTLRRWREKRGCDELEQEVRRGGESKLTRQ